MGQVCDIICIVQNLFTYELLPTLRKTKGRAKNEDITVSAQIMLTHISCIFELVISSSFSTLSVYYIKSEELAATDKMEMAVNKI